MPFEKFKQPDGSVIIQTGETFHRIDSQLREFFRAMSNEALKEIISDPSILSAPMYENFRILKAYSPEDKLIFAKEEAKRRDEASRFIPL